MPPLVAAQTTTDAVVNVTAWHDCTETLPNDSTTSGNFQLACSAAQTFTRINIRGTVELSNSGFADNTVLDSEWQCVPSDSEEAGSYALSLTPSGKCTPLPDNTFVTAMIGRLRYGWWLTFDSYVPYGYLLVNYTANATDANCTAYKTYFPQSQLLCDNTTWGVNDTCSGLANMEMSANQGCSSNIPEYVTDDYLASCGVCGDNPYLPLMTRNVAFGSNDANANNNCGTAALCYPCNSTNSTQLERRTAYQTFAFGQCAVYRIEPQSRLFIDAFVNASILNHTVANSVLVSGAYDQGQAQMSLSMRSPTMRGSLRIDADDATLQARPPLSGYIISCPDSTATNSTRPQGGVLGPFNWLYNTSGYVPSFRWNQLVQPPAPLSSGLGRQRLQGAWFYLTPDEYAERFQPTDQPVDQCAKSHLVNEAKSLTGTNVLYSNDSALPVACAAPPYNWSAPSTGNYYEQVHPGQGACVPGMDPRYNVEPGRTYATNWTVCQMLGQMDLYSQVWGAATPDVRKTMDAPPFLPPQYDMNHPQFYLMQLNDLQYQQAQSQLVLMYTPPRVGQGVVATYDLTVDISTAFVPYVTEDLLFVVMNNPGPNSQTLCRYWMPTQHGYYSFEVCQLGKIKTAVLNVTVSGCDPGMRFLEEHNSTHRKGLDWVVSEDQRSATYNNLALFKDPSSTDAGPYGCAQSSTLLFNLTDAALSELGNTNGALLESCQVTLDMQVTLEGGNVTTLTQHINQSCAAVNSSNVKWNSYNTSPDKLIAWQLWGGVLLGGAIVVVLTTVIVVGLVYTIKRGGFIKKTRYATVKNLDYEMTEIDTTVSQTGVGM